MEEAQQKQAPKPWISQEELDALPLWTCDLTPLKAEGDQNVGDILSLSCTGPTVSTQGELEFAPIDPNQKYVLRFLDVSERSENSIRADVTSYMVGEHDLKLVPVKTNEGALFKVESLKLQVKTVITEPEPKPFGPLPPFALSYPYWLGLLGLAVLTVAVVLGLVRWRRRRQMARVIEELKQHNTALGAYNQYNKDVRKLGRDYIFGSIQEWSNEQKKSYVEKIDSIFRMYLLREFFVPALDWNSQLVLKTIAHQDKKRFVEYGQDLKKTLRELDQANDHADRLKTHDCQQLTQMCNKITQTIWNVRRKSK